jgi:hypothetical protein
MEEVDVGLFGITAQGMMVIAAIPASISVLACLALRYNTQFRM